MRYLKMLGLAAASTATLALGGVGPAMATTFTCAPNVQCSSGTVVHEQNDGHVILHIAPSTITCEKATLEWVVDKAGSLTETVTGHITEFSFANCGSWTVDTLKDGALESHTQSATSNGNGTMTGTESELTVEGFGFHCIFRTNNTDLGVVTGGSPAVFDLAGTIPRVGGRSGVFCGSGGEVTGRFKITKPTYFYNH